jgi:hypothetical protein
LTYFEHSLSIANKQLNSFSSVRRGRIRGVRGGYLGTRKAGTSSQDLLRFFLKNPKGVQLL